MQTGLILRRNAGKTVPRDFLELALKNNPKGWGAAIVTDGEVMTNKGYELDVELFEETVKTFEKSDITFYLCNSEAALNGDDVSPYGVISKDGKDLLVAFVEGNFPSYAEAKSSHPPEFFFINKFLVPKLTDVYDLGDIDLVMKLVKKDSFKKELMLNVVSRGTITLVSNTGESLTFAQSDTAKEYDWGWVSNHYGYGQQTKEASPPPAEKKKSMFPSKSTVREKAPVSASPAIASVTTVPPTEASVVKKYTTKKWGPASHLSRKERKNEWKRVLGFCPTGWENKDTKVDVYFDPTDKLVSYAEVKRLGLAAVALPQRQLPEKAKDTETENLPDKQTVPVGEEKKVAGLVPLMSPTTREHIKKIMADTNVQKLIGENADIISDPTKVQKLEGQFASFCNQLGMKKIDDFMPWSYEMMFNLAREKPDGIAVMCWTFRNMLASRMAKETKEEAVPSQTDPQTETQPVKRSMFPPKKAA